MSVVRGDVRTESPKEKPHRLRLPGEMHAIDGVFSGLLEAAEVFLRCHQ
jgi:hypothetical protein